MLAALPAMMCLPLLVLSRPPSVRFNVRQLYHFAPLLGFVGDELAEIGGRAAKRGAIQVGKLCLEPGIGECGVDLLVELVDDLGGRVPGRSETKDRACLIARDELAYGRDVRQRVRARRRSYCKRAQLAGPDIPNQ